MTDTPNFKPVFPAKEEHERYAQAISDLIREAASQARGLAQRSVEHILNKIREKKAIIIEIPANEETATAAEIVGFCYIDTWQNDEYVVNSGLIVKPIYRRMGVATLMKRTLFEHVRTEFPRAKIFGLTTSGAVMKINTRLGYRPVSYADLTTDKGFWKGCESCANYDVLQRTGGDNCLCTGMIYEPEASRPYPNEETLCYDF